MGIVSVNIRAHNNVVVNYATNVNYAMNGKLIFNVLCKPSECAKWPYPGAVDIKLKVPVCEHNYYWLIKIINIKLLHSTTSTTTTFILV